MRKELEPYVNNIWQRLTLGVQFALRPPLFPLSRIGVPRGTTCAQMSTVKGPLRVAIAYNHDALAVDQRSPLLASSGAAAKTVTISCATTAGSAVDSLTMN